MRVLFVVFVGSSVVAACAGKPSAPPRVSTTYVSPTGGPLAALPTRADETIDPKILADAKNAGYSLVNTKGQLLYCRTDVKLGTHIRKNTDTVCLTEQELIAMHEQTRNTLEQFVPHRTCVWGILPGMPLNSGPPC